MMILLLIFLLFAVPAQAQVVLDEGFEGYSYWSLTYNQDGRPSCPRNIFGSWSPWEYCDADTCTSNTTDPGIEITTAAKRTGNMGFRLNVFPDSGGTCNENGLTSEVGYFSPSLSNFYVRAYMRFNFTSQSNYKKLFRIKDAAGLGTQRFILDLYRNPSGSPSGTWFVLTTSADSFNNHTANTSYNFATRYTANTWICVEIFIDQTNDRWTLWIDGVQQGSPVSFPASNYSIGGIMIGGNQCGSGTLHTVDYDDIVVSTSYVGTGTTPVTAPTVTITSPTGGTTYSTAATPLTIAGSVVASGTITGVTYANGSSTGSCTGTTSFSCSVPLTTGSNTVVISATDENGTGTDTLTVTYDTTAPVITNTTSATQTCASSPKTVTMTATTNENATCRYSTGDLGYSSMSTAMTTTGATSHSVNIPLSCGASYTYYISCIDALSNANTAANNTPVSFTIASADTTPPSLSNISPVGNVLCQPGNPARLTFAVTTNKAATCRWSDLTTTYDNMEHTYTTTDGLSHSTINSETCYGGERTYFTACRSTTGYTSDATPTIFYIAAGPTLSTFSPSGTYTCAANPTVLSFVTNTNSSCRYHPTDTNWDNMTAMSTTGTINHSQAISNPCGSSYTYNVVCRSTAGNESPLSIVAYTVSPESTPSATGVIRAKYGVKFNTDMH